MQAFWGFVADMFYAHRASVLLCTMVGMLVSNLLMALAPAQILAGTVLIGFNFGGMFAIAPVLVAEQFGHRHFGTNWGCTVLAPAIGSIAFNALFGIVYEHETAEGCDNCIGYGCYQVCFCVSLAWFVVCA